MLNKPTDYIASLAKGLKVIEAFGPTSPRLSISEAAAASGLDRAATRRVLLTLHREGYADYDGKFFKISAVTKEGIKDLNYFLIETLKNIPKIELKEVQEDDKSFKWDDYHENILDEKNNEDDFDDWNEDDYDVKVFYKP